MKLKKISALLIVINIILLFFGGCNKNTEELIGNSNITEITGAYIEGTLGNIDGMDNVYGMAQINKHYIIIGSDTTRKFPFLIYTSEDSGQNWNQEDVNWINKSDTFGEGTFIYSADINAEGEIIIVYDNMDAEGNILEKNVIYIDKNHKEKVITSYSNETVYVEVCFGNNSNLFINTGNEIIEYDLSGEKKVVYDVSDAIDFLEKEEELFVLTSDALYVYDEVKGEMIVQDKSLCEPLKEELKEACSEKYRTIGRSKNIIYIKENIVYLMLPSGIYKHVLGGELIEHVVNAEGKNFSEIEAFMVTFLVNEEESFYIIYVNTNNQNQVEYINLVYSESVEVKEKIKLKVYALEDNDYLKNIIKSYENSHENIEIQLEIGMDADSNISASDAISALNTEMMAGEGPDILIMDGLDIESYKENDMLENISDVYSNINNEYNCLDNVISVYKTRDDVYAIPSRFSVPIIFTQKDVLNKINNFHDIAVFINSCEDRKEGNDLSIYKTNDLYKVLYPAMASDIFDADGEYHEDKMKEFLIGSKEIWQAIMNHTSENDLNNRDRLNNKKYFNPTDLLFNQTDITIGSINYYGMIHDIITGMYYLDNCNYDLFSNNECRAFIPQNIVSISALSDNKEEAKEFIKDIFDVQSQSIELYSDEGIAVNIDALEKSRENRTKETISYSSQDSTDTYYDVKIITDDEFNTFIDLFRSLEKPVYTDKVITDIICSNMEAYFNDEITIDDAMDRINHGLALYYNE